MTRVLDTGELDVSARDLRFGVGEGVSLLGNPEVQLLRVRWARLVDLAPSSPLTNPDFWLLAMEMQNHSAETASQSLRRNARMELLLHDATNTDPQEGQDGVQVLTWDFGRPPQGQRTRSSSREFSSWEFMMRSEMQSRQADVINRDELDDVSGGSSYFAEVTGTPFIRTSATEWNYFGMSRLSQLTEVAEWDASTLRFTSTL